MSNTMTTTRSPSMSTIKVDKSKKLSKVVILRLTPELLSRFDESTPKKESKSTSSAASSPPATTNDIPVLKVAESADNADNASESNSTPAPGQDASTSTDPPKKRKGPLPGSKRGLSLTVDGLPKPRGKPGPKKKPRLEDGTIDHSAKQAPGIAVAAGHKLGPKANQGAINAGLRALDRSGKPCRKWARKPFQLKSFTGVMWQVPSWKGTEGPSFLNGDESSDTKDVSQLSSSDVKPNESDTAMDSNLGDGVDPMVMSTPAASSPPPLPVQSSAITA